MTTIVLVTGVFVFVAFVAISIAVANADDGDGPLCARRGCGDRRDLHDEGGDCHGRMGVCHCTGFIEP